MIHFGLGNATSLDSLEVHWPGGGVQTLYNVNTNQTVNIQEPIGLQLSPLSVLDEVVLFPNPSDNPEKISIRIKSKTEKQLKFVLKDLMGRAVAESYTDVSEGSNLINFIELFPNIVSQNQLLIFTVIEDDRIIYTDKLHLH
jgi:hypothetical protein